MRAFYFISAVLGVVVFCGAVACLFEFLRSGSFVLAYPENQATTWTGVKALVLIAALFVGGGGLFGSSVYQFRKCRRRYD